MKQKYLVFCLLLTNSFPSVDFGLGLKQNSLVRIKVLTCYLNRYMPLAIIEEKLLKFYVNTFELDIYRRKRVLREKGGGEWERRRCCLEVHQLLVKRCLESKLGRNILLLPPFLKSFPRMYCIFHFTA